MSHDPYASWTDGLNTIGLIGQQRCSDQLIVSVLDEIAARFELERISDREFEHLESDDERS